MGIEYYNYNSDVTPNYVRLKVGAIKEVMSSAVPCAEIWLFGSYAYGKPHQYSDFDLFVVLADSNMNIIEALQKIWSDVYHSYSKYPTGYLKNLDILADHVTSFYKDTEDTSFEMTIKKKGIKIYDQSSCI